MKLERVALASSMALVGGFLLREVIKVRIRLRTMALRYSILQSLLEDDEFIALRFNPFYDNRTFAKDLVALEAYMKSKDNSKRTMPRVPLDAVNKGDAYTNETDYSAYELTRENVKTILDCFDDDPEIKYVLFFPEPYREDGRYFSYRIIPADEAKNALPLRGRVAVQTQALTTAEVSSEGGESTMMFSSLTMSTRLLYMDPSPPATAGFSML